MVWIHRWFTTAYFKNEKIKEKQTQERVKKLLARKDSYHSSLSVQQQEKLNKETDSLVHSLFGQHTTRQWTERVWLHVDMDAFFASVEVRDNPSLADKPVAVGGLEMISTANYMARSYGVRSAMPGFIGKHLCSELVFVHPHFDKYQYASKQIRDIFSQYDPNFLHSSLDEGALDVTNYLYHQLFNKTVFLEKGDHVQDSSFRKKETNRAKTSFGRRHFLSDIDENTMGNCTKEKRMTPTKYENAKNEEYFFQVDDNHSDQEETHLNELNDLLDCLGDSTKSLGGEMEDFVGHRRKKRNSFYYSDNEVTLSLFSEPEIAKEAYQLASEIQKKVFDATQLTCSIGIAPNRSLAKICAEMKKPNGIFLVPANFDAIRSFLWPLPVRKICGIGKVTQSLLAGLDIFTVEDLFLNRCWIRLLFSWNSFIYFMEICHGYSVQNTESSLQIQNESQAQKSVSVERTFSPTCVLSELLKICREICDRLETDLDEKKVCTRGITVKTKSSDFKVRQHSLLRLYPIFRSKDLYEAATSLLLLEIGREEHGRVELRLLGVRATPLEVYLLYSTFFNIHLILCGIFPSQINNQ